MEWSLLGEDHRLLLLFHVVQGGVGDPKHKRIPISSSVWHVLQKMMGGRGAGQGVVLAGVDSASIELFPIAVLWRGVCDHR